MKLIDLIKNNLGIDAKDLDKEADIETMKTIQENLTEALAVHDAEEQETEILKQEKENEEFKQRLIKAREKKHNINRARKTAEQRKGYSAGRLARLRRLGKVD